MVFFSCHVAVLSHAEFPPRGIAAAAYAKNLPPAGFLNAAVRAAHDGLRASNKKRPCLLHQETKAQTSAVPLSLSWFCHDHSKADNGASRRGLLSFRGSAQRSKVIFTPASSPPFTKRRLSGQVHGRYSSFSLRLCHIPLHFIRFALCCQGFSEKRPSRLQKPGQTAILG